MNCNLCGRPADAFVRVEGVHLATREKIVQELAICEPCMGELRDLEVMAKQIERMQQRLAKLQPEKLN